MSQEPGGYEEPGGTLGSMRSLAKMEEPGARKNQEEPGKYELLGEAL